MTGQMCWLSKLGNDDTKILHLRETPSEPWRVYTSSRHCVPDYAIPGGSKGFATMQKLMQMKWALVSTEQAEAELRQMVTR